MITLASVTSHTVILVIRMYTSKRSGPSFGSASMHGSGVRGA